MPAVNAAAMAFIAFLTVQRLAELVLARRNTARLLARGAVEYGARHYPLIVILHAAWLASIALSGWDQPVRPGWLVLFVLLQAARFWVLASLGERWTTRIIIMPDAPLVARGPYRLMAHPNYAVVVAEIAVAPMVLGLWQIALLFSLLNAAVLTIRLRAENRALAGLRRLTAADRPAGAASDPPTDPPPGA